MYDCIIIGKGPAGISAAIYLKRASLNVLVIGKDGGALEKTKKIDNYYGFVNTISGTELLENGLKQAKRLGIEIKTDEVINISLNEEIYTVETRNQTLTSKTVILATGTKRENANIPGIEELEGRGISYCAVCDAFFYKNKQVAVLGNGDYALKEAITLSGVANKVTILTNGKEIVQNRSELPDNIEVNDRSIESINGKEKIENVSFLDKSSLNVNGLFIAVGIASSTDFARKLGAITNNNNIVVDKDMKTNVLGLYAAGDCTGGTLQISKAVCEGMMAATSAIKYIRKEQKRTLITLVLFKTF